MITYWTVGIWGFLTPLVFYVLLKKIAFFITFTIFNILQDLTNLYLFFRISTQGASCSVYNPTYINPVTNIKEIDNMIKQGEHTDYIHQPVKAAPRDVTCSEFYDPVYALVKIYFLLVNHFSDELIHNTITFILFLFTFFTNQIIFYFTYFM